MNQVEMKRRQIQGFANVVGLITLIIFGRMIGDNGIAYVGAAYEIFSLLFILFGKNVSDVLGRILRGRSSRGQYKNAARMRVFAMLFQGVMGIVGSVAVAVLGSMLMTNVLKMQNGSVLALILAPVFLIQMISAVLLGYFQGDGTELYTVIVTLLRKILFLAFGFLFIGGLREYGQKVSALLKQEDFVAMYGAMGVVLAYLVTELIVLILLIAVSIRFARRHRKEKKEGMRTTDSFGSLIRTLYGNMTGLSLVQLLARIPILIGIIFVQKSVETTVVGEYGVYYGKYLLVVVTFILLLDMIAIASGAKVASFRKKDESRYTRVSFQGSLCYLVAMGLYGTVFFTTMGEQLAELLCENNVTTAASLLTQGAFLVVFAVVGDYFVRILLSEDKWYLAAAGLGTMNVVYMISLTLLLNNGVTVADALVYAGLLGTGVMVLMMGILTGKVLRIMPDFVRTLVIPAGCACVTGLFCMFLGNSFTPHLGNLVTLIVCLVLSFPVYWILLLLLRTIREKELKFIPGSGWLRFIGQLLQLF